MFGVRSDPLRILLAQISRNDELEDDGSIFGRAY